MKRGLTIGIVAVIACCAVAFGVHHQMRRTAQMRAALVALQAANQSDSVFTTDSLALELVRYYDHPLHFWTTSNDRLMAHYLLGRCYADMGEAPRAIEEYSEAVEQADTTASDCDLRTLRAVYGQMANVFHQQNLPEEEIEAEQRYIHYSNKMGDSLQIAIGMENLTRPYYLIGDSDAILRYSHAASEIFYSIGRSDLAANALNTSAFIETQRGNTAEARWLIDLIRQESSFFDSLGNLRPGREMFYYTIGLYFENSNKLDSAEYYYRRLLPAHEYEAAYRGLLSVYEKREIADSIGKFARLYADANDAMHRKMSTQAVAQAAKSYQYAHSERRAHINEEKAKNRLQSLYSLSAILLLLSVVSFYFHRRHREELRQKILELSQISSSLTFNQEQLKNARKELDLLSDDRQQLILSKQKEIERLLAEIQKLQDQYTQLKDQDKKLAYYNSIIVKKICSSCDKSSQPSPLSDDEWEQAIDLFYQTFPSFVDFVKSRAKNFSDNEWKIVLLTDMEIKTGDMASLMSITTSRISQLKQQVAHILFDSDSTNSMPFLLKRKLHGNF